MLRGARAEARLLKLQLGRRAAPLRAKLELHGLLRTHARRRMMGKEKILCAEDDPYTRERIQSTLMDMGAGELHVAASGYEVLKVLNDFEPTVIITDWHMEPVSGLELLRCIRRGGTGLPANTPVIFFTSQKDTESTMTANRNGVNMVIGKPVLPSTLRDNVLKVVEKKYHVKQRPRSVN